MISFHKLGSEITTVDWLDHQSNFGLMVSKAGIIPPDIVKHLANVLHDVLVLLAGQLFPALVMRSALITRKRIPGR